MHRIFVTLPISGNLQKIVVRWTQDNIALPVRWVAGKNLHITLLPPWETDDVDPAKMALATLAGSASFIVNFTHVTFGPNPHEARLIWAAGATPSELLNLQKHSERAFGQPSQNRPFRLHLTLARFRAEDFRAFSVKSLNKSVDWQDRITAIQLLESHLLPAGAEYQVLCSQPLASL